MNFKILIYLICLCSISNIEAFTPRYHAPLDVRILNQDNYTRLVFEWIGDAHYTIEEKNNDITIIFDRLTSFNPHIITSKLPQRVRFKGIKTNQHNMIFSFEAYPKTQEKISTRHYKQGFKIVLDILFENKTNTHIPYKTNLQNAHATLKRIDQKNSNQKNEPLSTNLKIRLNTKNNIDEVFIPIKGKINPILYKRGQNIWLIQNSNQNWDISLLKKFSPKIFKQDKVTALLLNTSQSEMPKVQYEKTGVKLHFNTPQQVKNTNTSIPFKLNRDSILDSKIEIPIQNNKKDTIPIKFKDPLTGEDLYLLETDPNFSIPTEQKFVDFKLLKTSAGLSLIPYTDDLTFNQDKDILTISRPHGLRIGTEPAEPSEKNDDPKEKNTSIEEANTNLSTKTTKHDETEHETSPPKSDEAQTTNLTESSHQTEHTQPQNPANKAEKEAPLQEHTENTPKQNQIPISENVTTNVEPPLENTSTHSEPVPEKKNNTFFDLTKWYPFKDFTQERNLYEAKIIETDPPSSESVYNLASFFIARDLGAEGQNVLMSFREKVPEAEKSSNFQGLMGIFNLYKEQYEDALKNFEDKQLDSDPSINTWRWVANFLKNDEYDEKTLEAPKEINLSLLPFYLRHSIYLRLLKNDLAQKKFNIFDQNYAQIKQHLLNNIEKNYLEYLTGWSDYLKGNPIGGLKKWKKLTTHFDRFTSSRARYALASKGPENNFITKKEAIQDLETLRFAWRGDNFEYKVIQLLGSYLIDLQLYKKGLKTLKELINRFPDNTLNKEITTKLSETFTNIFTKEKISSKYSPMDLILLYESFKELSPLDKNADLIQEKIAQSYFALNLPDDGQKILDHLIKFRSEGDEKSLRGLTLAQELSSAQKGNDALSVLDASETATMKPELAEKRQKLRIMLLKQKEEFNKALNLIANKTDIESQRLKTQIYIDQKEWSKATEIYDTIFNTQKDLTTEKDLFYYMICLTYVGNYKKIEELSKIHKDFMEKEPYKNAFLLIASTLKPGNIKKTKEQLEDFLTKFKTYNTSAS